MTDSANKRSANVDARVRPVTYWRVEGSLFEMSALRSIAFFNWNSQSFLERWLRRAGMVGLTILRMPYYLMSRTFATRALHSLLRGISKDRFELLGEEYFQYELKPRMRRESVEKLVEAVRNGERVILVGQLLEQIMRPLAEYFAVEGFIANRLEFRDGAATGRLLDPVIRPRGPFAWLASGSADGHLSAEKLLWQLDWKKTPELLQSVVRSPERPAMPSGHAVELLGSTPRVDSLNVRESLAGKHLLLIGVTGFIGKVWLVDLLEKIPDIRKVILLIRRNRTTTAQRRFEKIVEESPTFDALQEIHGAKLAQFLQEKVEVVEGDVSQPGLGLDTETQTRLMKSLDVIANSAGLTDFNPDLRDARSSNVDSAIYLLDFLRKCDHAGLMHLSTCYVVGMRDGRVTEELRSNYNPAGHPDFDAEREIASLREMVQRMKNVRKARNLLKPSRGRRWGGAVILPRFPRRSWMAW